MWDDTNGQLIDSPISDDGTSVTVGSSRNLVIAGNLTVQGTTTTVDSNTVNIGDAMLSLNADIASDGTPSEDAGIEVERGASANKKLYWDESLDSWRVGGQLIIDDIPADSSPATTTRILTEKIHATDTTVQRITVADIGTALNVGSHSVLLDATNRANVAKTSNTYTVTHGLGSKLVNVQVIDATTHETIFVDVARPTENKVTVAFAASVSDGDYICMTTLVGNLDTTQPAP